MFVWAMLCIGISVQDRIFFVTWGSIFLIRGQFFELRSIFLQHDSQFFYNTRVNFVGYCILYLSFVVIETRNLVSWSRANISTSRLIFQNKNIYPRFLSNDTITLSETKCRWDQTTYRFIPNHSFNGEYVIPFHLSWIDFSLCWLHTSYYAADINRSNNA